MKRTIVILLGVFAINFCHGQNNKLNRDSFVLRVMINDSNLYKANINTSPYILQDNTLQIYPGEKIFVEIEESQGEVVSIKTVKQNLNPEKTIEISFEQTVEGRKHKSMILRFTKNPFKYDINYTANIYLLKYNKWVRTDVSPVKTGIGSFETWPDIITTIALSNWSFRK